MSGFVSLVGAGPWDPGLLTLAGRDRLARADVVIADYLANPAHLLHCRPDAVVIQREAGPRGTGTLPQAGVHDLLLEHARAGRRVVRLKGGDPVMFGRAGEEAAFLREHGVAYEIVPGVSSPIAAPATAGIPVTHRDFTPAVTFVSGWEAYDKSGMAVEWEHLARAAGTLVFLMGVRNVADNMARLVAAGRSADTPAAVVRWGTRGTQRTVVATVGTIAAAIAAADLRAPAVLVVGEVVALREQLAWYERRPLFGRRVVLARAQPPPSLLATLADLGADVVAFPTLEVGPARDPAALARLPVDVAALPAGSGVLFSSAHGVRAALSALAGSATDARAFAGKRLAAIGPGTSAALAEAGLRPDIVPETASSEGLVEALRARGWLGARWLHCRGPEGRDVLEREIVAAGGSYERIVVYDVSRPRPPALLVRSLLPAATGGEGVDCLAFGSGQAARSFLRSVEEVVGEEATRELCRASRIVALGPVTARAIQALGFEVHTIALDTSDAALVAAIRETLEAPALTATS